MNENTGTLALGTHPINRLGYGAMQLAGPGVFGPPKKRDEAIRVLRRAVDAGVNHIDTAQYYGPTVVNELLREALSPYPDDLALVSKVGANRDAHGNWIPAQAPADLRQGVLDNLETLHTDHLAAVNLRVHGWGGETSNDRDLFHEQLEMMVSLRDEGLILGVGLSNVSREQLEYALTVTDIVCVQNPFNVTDRSGADVLELTAEKSIPFVPFFPLGSGFSPDNPVLSNPEVRTVASRLQATPAQVALAWLLHHSRNIALIPGTSSLTHLEENLQAGTLELDGEALGLLNAATPHVQERSARH